MEINYDISNFRFNISKSQLDDLRDLINEYFDLREEYWNYCNNDYDLTEKELQVLKQDFNRVVTEIINSSKLISSTK